jgi:hypothetical protein
MKWKFCTICLLFPFFGIIHYLNEFKNTSPYWQHTWLISSLFQHSVVGYLNVRPINDCSWSFIGHVILINVRTFMNVRPMDNITLYFFCFSSYRFVNCVLLFSSIYKKTFIIKKSHEIIHNSHIRNTVWIFFIFLLCIY